MLTEDFVSYDAAKLLRDAGFNEYCYYFRGPGGLGSENLFRSNHAVRNFEKGMTIGGAVACPTIQMALKWLRINHNIFIHPSCYNKNGKDWYDYFINPINGKPIRSNCLSFCDRKFESPERALDAAIIYVLSNLI